MTCCPTCGQTVADNRFMLDAVSCRVSFGSETRRLSVFKAHLLKVLVDAMPRFVSAGVLHSMIYRGHGEEDRQIKTVAVHISQLRKMLVGMPIVIQASYGSGYKVVVGESAMQAPAIVKKKMAPPVKAGPSINRWREAARG